MSAQNLIVFKKTPGYGLGSPTQRELAILSLKTRVTKKEDSGKNFGAIKFDFGGVRPIVTGFFSSSYSASSATGKLNSALGHTERVGLARVINEALAAGWVPNPPVPLASIPNPNHPSEADLLAFKPALAHTKIHIFTEKHPCNDPKIKQDGSNCCSVFLSNLLTPPNHRVSYALDYTRGEKLKKEDITAAKANCSDERQAALSAEYQRQQAEERRQRRLEQIRRQKLLMKGKTRAITATIETNEEEAKRTAEQAAQLKTKQWKSLGVTESSSGVQRRRIPRKITFETATDTPEIITAMDIVDNSHQAGLDVGTLVGLDRVLNITLGPDTFAKFKNTNYYRGLTGNKCLPKSTSLDDRRIQEARKNDPEFSRAYDEGVKIGEAQAQQLLNDQVTLQKFYSYCKTYWPSFVPPSASSSSTPSVSASASAASASASAPASAAYTGPPLASSSITDPKPKSKLRILKVTDLSGQPIAHPSLKTKSTINSSGVSYPPPPPSLVPPNPLQKPKTSSVSVGTGATASSGRKIPPVPPYSPPPPPPPVPHNPLGRAGTHSPAPLPSASSSSEGTISHAASKPISAAESLMARLAAVNRGSAELAAGSVSGDASNSQRKKVLGKRGRSLPPPPMLPSKPLSQPVRSSSSPASTTTSALTASAIASANNSAAANNDNDTSASQPNKRLKSSGNQIDADKPKPPKSPPPPPPPSFKPHKPHH